MKKWSLKTVLICSILSGLFTLGVSDVKATTSVSEPIESESATSTNSASEEEETPSSSNSSSRTPSSGSTPIEEDEEESTPSSSQVNQAANIQSATNPAYNYMLWYLLFADNNDNDSGSGNQKHVKLNKQQKAVKAVANKKLLKLLSKGHSSDGDSAAFEVISKNNNKVPLKKEFKKLFSKDKAWNAHLLIIYNKHNQKLYVKTDKKKLGPSNSQLNKINQKLKVAPDHKKVVNKYVYQIMFNFLKHAKHLSYFSSYDFYITFIVLFSVLITFAATALVLFIS